MTVNSALTAPRYPSATVRSLVQAQQLHWEVKGKAIVSDVSFHVAPGEFVGIIGPNGSGKTSLISLLAGLLKPSSGSVTLENKNIRHYSRRHLAQKVALVEQQAETSERLTALQAVSLGRTPWLSLLSPWSKQDDDIVQTMLEKVDLQRVQNRCWNTFSGGEKQRLHIARALAQQPKALLMDEPTNHLDIQHQIGLLNLVKRQKLTVIAALHDLNHAAMFCDRILVMKAGQLVMQGSPATIFTPENLSQWFGINAIVEQAPDGLSCFIRYQRPE
ncbi:TPA: ABC transporter ATP-binding protein [Citrobacter koseri]